MGEYSPLPPQFASPAFQPDQEFVRPAFQPDQDGSNGHDPRTARVTRGPIGRNETRRRTGSTGREAANDGRTAGRVS